MRLKIVLMAACLAALQASACINEIGTNHRGERVAPFDYSGESLKPYLVTPTSKSHLMAWSGNVVADARKRPTFKNLNNLAALLIRFERLPEAERLLQSQEKKYPGHFETAANLGTAYELMGRNEDALKWIGEGVVRNPEDHYGTEWLHARILEAKLGRLAPSPPGQSILALDFGSGAMPVRPKQWPKGNSGKPLSLFELAYALRYQLQERIEFVPAPEPMVAALLLDWANLELLAGTVESADVLYDAALRYGSGEGKLIALRKAEVARILKKAKSKAPKNGRCELCEPPRPGR